MENAEIEDVVISFNDFIHRSSLDYSQEELELIKEAFKLALDTQGLSCHQWNGLIIEQSVEMAIIASTMIGLGIPSVVSALLHPSVETGSVSMNHIESVYGKDTANIIKGLIRLAKIDNVGAESKFQRSSTTAKAEKENQKKLATHLDNYISLWLTVCDDVRAILLKLSARVYLMRRLKNLPEDKQKEISRETERFHSRLAHRLGLYAIKTELEEIAMKYNEPVMYKLIAEKLNESKAARNEYITEFIKPIKTELAKKAYPHEIKGRPKSIHSIWTKMKAQGVEFEGIYDLFAIRVILTRDYTDKTTGLVDYKAEKADCWNVYSLITDVYPPNSRRLRDWISNPKSSGYESLHTTVFGPDGKWVEVQIRTQRMDEVAEKGHAAHWKYKNKGQGSGHEAWLAQIRDLLENPQPDSFSTVSEAKSELYSDVIYVFTPDGELKKSRVGATILDFAFEVHTDLGKHCTGAIVNGNHVSLKQVLHNGDQVKIITSKTQKPKLEWLKIVVSPRAKAKIRRIIKEEQSRYADDGKEIVKTRLEKFKLEFNDRVVSKLMKQFGFSSVIDFFNAVGGGDEKNKIKPADLDEQLRRKEPTDEIPIEQLIEKAEAKAPVVQSESKNDDYLIIDETLSRITFERAKCCNPIPGDPIFGFITVSKGTRIHKMNCPNAKEMYEKYSFRIVKAKWSKTVGDSDFLANLRLGGINQMGVLSSISKIVTNDMKINVKSIHIDSKENDKEFKGTLSVYVKNTQVLDELIQKLVAVKGLLSVSRY